MTTDDNSFLRYRVERLVRARPDQLWDLITDPHQATAAQRAIKRVEVFTSGPVGPGTRYRQFGRVLGLPVTMDVEIEDFEPMHRVTARIHYPMDGTRTLDEFRLTPTGGGTLVTSTCWAVGAGPTRRALMTLSRPVDHRVARRGMAELAALVESR